MPQVHWKELEEDYIIDIYNPYEVYFNFDFYKVHDLGDGQFMLVDNQRIDFTLETFLKVLSKRIDYSSVYSEFRILFRIDDSDMRFYANEILLEEDTFEILKKAVDFCREYWNANLKKERSRLN